ncbi:MAG: NifB/NifX family molybdenum-iron cluster-binding protein [Sulfuricella sp.]|nr:NifB/NifX family molybdenum-iron cluster-binding protein [Sulfuricella sp.]
MKIAVSSHNLSTISGHAGRCRKFWIYEVEGKRVARKSLLELPLAQRFQACAPDSPHPLDVVNVLITGGMKTGLYQNLKQKGILAVSTTETDPDRAVAAWLDGDLETMPPQTQELPEYS